MGEFDYQLLDEVIHSRIRTAVMAILAGVDEADFTILREKTGATDGNLGTHMRKLEEAGYVRAVKSFVERKPRTRYRLTDRGRRAFLKYVHRLQQMIEREGERGS